MPPAGVPRRGGVMNRGRQSVPGFAVLLAVVIAAGGLLAMTAGAADPTSGSVSHGQPTTGWNGKHYADARMPVPEGTTARVACTPPSDELCDHFTLNADIDPSHWDANRGGVEVVISWATETDDFDLYVHDSAGNLVGSAANG